MAYKLAEINSAVRADPASFVRECNEEFHDKIMLAADMVMYNIEKSPILLISGPSGSGKTTTSMKIEEELESRGIGSYALGMDSYYKTVDETSPRLPNGELDLESPFCLDMELLGRHFEDLAAGREIEVPAYNFAQQRRESEPSERIKLGKNEIVVVEGIHALNDMVTHYQPEAMKLYISARSDVKDEAGKVCFKGTWMRLVRRLVRDKLYRGAAPEYTMKLWGNIRRGEKDYIGPFKGKANFRFDSSLPYEVGLMRGFAQSFFLNVPDCERSAELKKIYTAFDLFEPVSAELIPDNALLREFIGGGKYKQV
ncbi:MAG: nucleoside kinase [Oscillospiraceae bacterium]|nr:nucleoside kinase [Oscillospiraceae bacterium]